MQSPPEVSTSKRALLIEPQALFVPYFVTALESIGLEVVGVRVRAVVREVRLLAPDIVVVDAAHVPTAPLLTIRVLRQALPFAHLVVYADTVETVWPHFARSLGADIVIGSRAEERDLVAALTA